MKSILSYPIVNIMIGALLGGIVVTSLSAQKTNTKPVDETELLMEQSLATMAKVRAATQKADKVVVEKVTEMKEEVKELKTQNEQLKEEVKVLEVAVATASAPSVPFDILAILPDSTN